MPIYQYNKKACNFSIKGSNTNGLALPAAVVAAGAVARNW
jgi:hypothetical protein